MKYLKHTRVLLLIVCLLAALAVTASAQTKIVQSGGYELRLTLQEDGTWSVGNNDYTKKDFGDLVIPAEVDGIPVTAIAENGFAGNTISGTITLPETLVEIRSMAFYTVPFTGNLVLPDSVTTIGENAFQSCKKMTGELSLPDGLVTIGEGAFGNCTGITGVLTMPDSVETIGSRAFYKCTGLTGLEITGTALQSIGSEAFYNCTGLTGDLAIPDSCGNIGYNAFYGSYQSGGLLTVGAQTIEAYAFKKTNFTGVILADGVQTVEKEVFKECKALTSLRIETTKPLTIGEDAFFGCTALTGDLTVPANTVSIAEYAFYDAYQTGAGTLDLAMETVDGSFRGTSFTTLILREGVKHLNNAFNNCRSLTGSLELPSTLVTIGKDAFYGCSGLAGELHIPEGVTFIGDRAFCGCKGLVGELKLPDVLQEIGASAFSGLTGLTGDLTIPDSVTSIGAGAFSECTGFDGTLTLPDRLQLLGAGVFRECENLMGELTIPSGITYIGDQTFDMCKKLTGSIVVPYGVESIGVNAFYGCTSLTGDLILPDSVTRVDSGAFNGCENLSGELVLTPNLTYIGSWAFAESKLTGSLRFSENLTYIGQSAFSGCSELSGELGLPYRVTGELEIGTAAFDGCTGLTGALIIPEGTTRIGNYTFSDCSGLTGDLMIPETVKSVGQWAFYGCSGLTGQLKLPSDLTAIQNYTFSGCRFTGELDLPDHLTTIGMSAFSGCCFSGRLDLPEGVTTIGSSAFANCSGFTGKLILPEALTEIAASAFTGCSGFTGRLDLPYDITSIGQYAFENCTGLTGTLYIPGDVAQIGNSAFRGCTGFTSLILPDSLTSIGSYAFYGCTGMSGYLLLPDGLKTIYDNAFRGCSGFYGELNFPDSLEGIGMAAFSGCSGFTGSIVIPNGITRVHNDMFANCTGLDGYVKIPYSAFEIGAAAFYNCAGIKTVYLPTTTKFSGSTRPFAGCTGVQTIYYGGEEGTFRNNFGLVGTVYYNSYPAKSLTLLAGSNLSFRVGQTITLEATYASDEIAEDLSFSWSSSHPEVLLLTDQKVEIKGKGYAAEVTATFTALQEGSSEVRVSGPFSLSDSCVVSSVDHKELVFVPRSGQSAMEPMTMEPGDTMELLFSYRSYGKVAQDLDEITWDTLVDGVSDSSVVSLTVHEPQIDGDHAATLTATVTALDYGGPVEIVVSGPGNARAGCTVVVPEDKLTILDEKQVQPEGVLVLREKVAEPFTLYVRYETLRDEAAAEAAIEAMSWISSTPDFFGCDENEHVLGTDTRFTPEVTWEKQADGVYLLKTELTPALEGVTALKIRTQESENGTFTDDVCLVYGTFDVDSYLAGLYERRDGTRLPEAEGLDQYLYELDAPSELIVDELEKKVGYIGLTAVWEALEVVYKTMDNPAAAVMDYTVRERDIYYALLLELLRDTVEEYTDLAAVQATAFGDEMCTYLQDSMLLAGMGDFTDNALFSRWLMDNEGVLNQNTFKDKMEIPGLIGDFMTAANAFAGTLNDYGKAMANAAVLEQVTDAMERVLEAMLAECPASEEPLLEALELCLAQVRKTGDELRQDAELGLLTSAGKRGYQAAFDHMWDGLMDDVKWSHPGVAAFTAAYAFGSTVCKEIGNTDDTLETYYKMLALENIREVALRAEDTLAFAWHEDPGGDTAAEYLGAVDMLYRLRREDVELALAAAQALIDAPEYAVSGDPEKMEQAVASFKEYQKSLDNTYRTFRQMWMNHFHTDYPDALLDLQYEDLFAEATGMRPIRVVVVACPVRVRVLDRNGNEVAYVGDDRVSCAAEDLAVMRVGEEKHIWFYGDARYTLEYEGYDSGTMNVTDRTYDADGELQRELVYYDLPVTAEQTYRAPQSGNLREPGGSYVAPHSDSSDYSGYTVRVEHGLLEIDGIPTTSARAREGQRITVKAAARLGGKPFKGWTSTVGTEIFADPAGPVTTLRMPAGDVVITAVYGEDYVGPLELTDEAGNALEVIPAAVFTAEVPVPEGTAHGLLAGYDAAGRLVWIDEAGELTENRCRFTVDNGDGKLADLKFFALSGSHAPVQGAVPFPKETE